MRQTKLIKRIGATLLAGVSVVSLMTSSFASASDSSSSTIKDSRIQIISSSDFLEPSDLDTLHIRLEDFPEIRNIEGTGTSMNVLSGTEKGAYSGIFGANEDDAANIKQKYITIVTSPSASVSDFEDVSFEAYWEDAGTLEIDGVETEISMSIKYYNIVPHHYSDVTQNLKAKFMWTCIDSAYPVDEDNLDAARKYENKKEKETGKKVYALRTQSEWGRYYVESNDVEITFYEKGSTTPITLENAYMTSYSMDGYTSRESYATKTDYVDYSENGSLHQEGRASDEATDVYILNEDEEGCMAWEEEYEDDYENVYKNAYWGTKQYGTSTKNAVTFRYQNVTSLTMSELQRNGHYDEGYHLYFTPLTATTPTAPKKSIQTSSTSGYVGVDEKNVVAGEEMYYWVDFEMPYSVASNFYVQSLSLTDTFDSNLTVHTSDIELQTITQTQYENRTGPGTTIDAGSSSASMSGQKLTYTFDSDWLENDVTYSQHNYYRLLIPVTVKANISSSVTEIDNTAQLAYNGGTPLESNTVVAKLTGKLTVVKYVADDNGNETLVTSSVESGKFVSSTNYVYFTLKNSDGKYVTYDPDTAPPKSTTIKTTFTASGTASTSTSTNNTRFYLNSSYGKFIVSGLDLSKTYTVEEVYASTDLSDNYILPTTMKVTYNSASGSSTTSTVKYGTAVAPSSSKQGTVIKLVNNPKTQTETLLKFFKYCTTNGRDPTLISTSLKDEDGNSVNSSLQFVIVNKDEGKYINATKDSDGVYTYGSLGSTTSASSVQRTVFKLKGSKFTVSNLPEGEYYIKELSNSTTNSVFTDLMDNASFTITSDGVATVRVEGVNTIPSGSLTFKKYVETSDGKEVLISDSAYSSEADSLKFAVLTPNDYGDYLYILATELADGSYAFERTGILESYYDTQLGTGTASELMRTEFTLGSDGSFTITGLPEGDYKIVELESGDCFEGTMADGTFTITANTTATVKGVNEIKTGSLEFTKAVKNSDGNVTDSSVITSSVRSTLKFAVKDSDGKYIYATKNSDGTYDLATSSTSGATSTFTLDSNNQIIINNMIVNETYTVVETKTDTTLFAGYMGSVSGTVPENSTLELTGYNVLKPGSMKFTKYVNDWQGNSLGVLSDSSDYASEASELEFTLLNTSRGYVTVGQVTNDVDGIYAFSSFGSSGSTLKLSYDGTIEISDLPVGNYKLYETTTTDAFTGKMTEISFTVTANKQTEISGVNTLVRQTGTLQFTKAIKDADGNVTDSSAASASAWSSLKFMIVDTSNSKYVTATKNSTGSYTYTGTSSRASATTFTLNSSHQFTVADMPEGGTYAVVETSTDYDIFTGLMSYVTGTIVADKTTSLTGYNQLKETGDLKFTKYYGVNNQSRKVLSSANDSDLNAAVSFVIVREADDIVDNDIYIIATGSDGVYTYSGHGRATSASITSYGTNTGASLFELSDAGTISVSGLPEGDYYIKEIDTSDEFIETMADVSFTITGGETTNTEGINFLKTGTLQFTKEVKDWNGNNIGTLDSDLEDEYDIDGAISSLTFKLVDASTGKYVTVSQPSTGLYLYNTSVTTTEMKLTSIGKFAVNLPLGTYTVVETSTDEEIFVGTMTSVSGTVTYNAVTSITGTNTLKQPTGTLQFTKAVKDEDGNVTDSSVLTSTVRGKLQFAVTDASNKNALVYATKNSDGTYTYAKNSSVSGATSAFTLDSKNQITIYKMPADTKYTVVETKTDTDTFTGLMTQVSGTVLKDETLSLTGYNQVLPEIGSFTITKKLTKAYYTDEEFVYEITQTDKSGNKTKFLAYISIPAGKTTGSITIDGAVSTYTYTVKEMDNNWRYTAVNDSTYLNVNGTKVTALSNTTLKSYINYSKNNSQNSMTFKLKYPKTNSFNCVFTNEGHDYWLDDGATVTNVMESIS